MAVAGIPANEDFQYRHLFQHLSAVSRSEKRFIMNTPKVFESEYRFCLILWENEPIKSSELVKLCKEQLGWKPTTTYTVIKRRSERGVLKNENTVVTSLVSKEQVQAAEIDGMVEKTFEGSLPAFIAAFTKHRRLSQREIDEVQQMIDRFREEETNE